VPGSILLHSSIHGEENPMPVGCPQGAPLCGDPQGTAPHRSLLSSNDHDQKVKDAKYSPQIVLVCTENRARRVFSITWQLSSE